MTRRKPWRGGARIPATAAEPEAEGGQLPGQPPKMRLTTSAMIASLAAEGQRTSPAPFGRALVELAKDRPEIVGMTADLSKYTDLHIFAKEYPDRFYQMGMAEQLLMLSAAGMAHEGFVPFVTTYAVFASRRTYDFISQGIAEEALNVKICCALPGLTTGYGPSHQATEDIAIFRGMPDLTIVDPCDALDTEQATHAIAAHDGPVYMRLLRGNVPLVLDEYDYKFELGKAKLVRDGADALVVSSGFMTMRALETAKLLEADRVNVAVLHTPTIKPLDEEAILREARRRGGRLVVVAENHTLMGGLGEAVAAVLLRAGVVPPHFRQVALPDAFLDAGALPTLHDRYGITAEAMAKNIKSWL
jgi:transketolase